MSRLDELKKQYPQLNLTFFDLMTRMDTSKSYKYLPLFCKIFAKRVDLPERHDTQEYKKMIEDLRTQLKTKINSIEGITDSEIYTYTIFVDFFNSDIYTTLNDFMSYNERNKLENKDVTSYKNIEDVRTALSLAMLKEMDEELGNQVIKEYEDDKWVVVRPLTFAASAKYGASTRWCTTYKKEKQYFERYWRQGVLVYFINKKTGYKFAMYKSLVETELSFWNAEDQRTDFISLEIDDYLYTIVKNISKSESTNKSLSSDEIQEQVHNECVPEYEKLRPVPEEIQVSEREYLAIPDELMERPIYEIQIPDNHPMNELQFYNGNPTVLRETMAARVTEEMVAQLTEENPNRA